ncbi:MAG TPA: SDR family oxidoreductase [Chloroflexota bacterium]|jgi:NAD(P)-dependent dehydrogenase (short-subunit alcohol dehydrogenase family)|nr:SDR family oxidoreductase [Chloroflexota bacterium]
MPASLFDLSGRAALVTGGARGLGLAMAQALGQYGARLALLDLDGGAAERAAETLRQGGLEVLSLQGDVTDADQVAARVADVVEAYGSLDILVNNAGIVANVPAEEMSLRDWQRVIDVNLTGVFLVAQAAGRQMIRQGRGSIINIASMSGSIANYPQPQCSYNASKAGVIMLTKSLASEWARYNIRVNAISPGYMRTDLTAKFFQDPALIQQWLDPTPMHRPGEPPELGGLAVYLASDASSFMTGSDILIDGGYTSR